MKKAKLIRGEKYEFLWVDTYNFLGWHHEDDIDGKTIDREFQSTLGYFIKNIKEWHIVAAHHNPNVDDGFPEWGNVVYIPRSAILKVRNL